MNSDEFQCHVIDALARLDVKVGTLVGNGQPGRVTILEKKVEDLFKIRWKFAGAIIAISAVVTFVVDVVIKH